MKLYALTTTLAVLSGCTHHRKLSDPSELVYEHVMVETTSAPGIPQHGRVIGSRYGYYVATDTGDIPFGNVKSITERRHLIGALEGLGLGILAGAAVGVAIGFAEGDDECNTSRGEDFCYYSNTAAENAALGGIILGVLGGVIGLAVGAARGSRYVYEF